MPGRSTSDTLIGDKITSLGYFEGRVLGSAYMFLRVCHKPSPAFGPDVHTLDLSGAQLFGACTSQAASDLGAKSAQVRGPSLCSHA